MEKMVETIINNFDGNTQKIIVAIAIAAIIILVQIEAELAAIGLLLKNRGKSKETIQKENEKLLKKYEKLQQKELEKLKTNAKKIDELKGVNNNASGT